jgi:hypothetical protein
MELVTADIENEEEQESLYFKRRKRLLVERLFYSLIYLRNYVMITLLGLPIINYILSNHLEQTCFFE